MKWCWTHYSQPYSHSCECVTCNNIKYFMCTYTPCANNKADQQKYSTWEKHCSTGSSMQGECRVQSSLVCGAGFTCKKLAHLAAVTPGWVVTTELLAAHSHLCHRAHLLCLVLILSTCCLLLLTYLPTPSRLKNTSVLRHTVLVNLELQILEVNFLTKMSMKS